MRVETTSEGSRLLRGGRPYYLRGGAGLQQLDQLRDVGGNTIRLWSADYAEPLLDEAHRAGLSVMLGLWLEPEDQHFSYYDPAMVEAQLQRVRQQVLRYRYHPALLMWNVGNEVEISVSGPRLFSAVGAIARMIHELDPYHPVTMSLVDFDHRARQLQEEAPEVDILSLNVYGRLNRLPKLLEQSGWQGPYIITEYGSPGYWESDSTNWHVPREKTSADKARFVSTFYRQYIQQGSKQCLGSYVYYWGSKFEYTPTWFSLFEPTGEKTETVDELRLLWQGHYPVNRAPRLTALRLAGRPASANVRLRPGQSCLATVDVTDPEDDPLVFQWELLPEMRPGADTKTMATRLEAIAGSVLRNQGRQAHIRMPSRPGPYRLYVRVFDGQGSVATANFPLLVEASVAEAPSTFP